MRGGGLCGHNRYAKLEKGKSVAQEIKTNQTAILENIHGSTHSASLYNMATGNFPVAARVTVGNEGRDSTALQMGHLV